MSADDPSAVAPDGTRVSELRALCESIAREAGSFAAAARRELGPGRRVDHETKSSDVDPVTEFDRATERLVVDRLRAARPDDSIVGEEGADHRGTSGLEWHVDPIDGTVNFVYDLAGWCTSVAVAHGGRPLAGAVYAPVVDELASAGLGEGASIGGVALRASGATDLATSLAATGFGYDVDRRRAQGARLAGLIDRVRDVRREGSAALDLAHVAAGRVDAYFEEGLNSWDVAAGILLVTEAGGVVTGFDGAPVDVRSPGGIVAAGAALHPALLELLGGAPVADPP